MLSASKLHYQDVATSSRVGVQTFKKRIFRHGVVSVKVSDEIFLVHTDILAARYKAFERVVGIDGVLEMGSDVATSEGFDYLLCLEYPNVYELPKPTLSMLSAAIVTWDYLEGFVVIGKQLSDTLVQLMYKHHGDYHTLHPQLETTMKKYPGIFEKPSNHMRIFHLLDSPGDTRRFEAICELRTLEHDIDPEQHKCVTEMSKKDLTTEILCRMPGAYSIVELFSKELHDLMGIVRRHRQQTYLKMLKAACWASEDDRYDLFRAMCEATDHAVCENYYVMHWDGSIYYTKRGRTYVAHSKYGDGVVPGSLHIAQYVFSDVDGLEYFYVFETDPMLDFGKYSLPCISCAENDTERFATFIALRERLQKMFEPGFEPEPEDSM